jgi:tripartite-type tricarboxylate transporter receptor subunit TctC
MMKIKRNNWSLWVALGVVFVVFTVVAVTTAFAQEKFPSKPITIVVPWSAGGRTDTLTRIVAPLYEKYLGQQVIVANKPGAGGYIGFKNVATSTPDGYTMGIAGASFLLRQYVAESKIRWEEFKWIGQVYSTYLTVCVNSESPWKTIDDLLTYARNPSVTLKHGTSGYGGASHVLSEGFAKAAGIKIKQVHYKGDAPSLVALASKETEISCAPIGSVRPLVEAGKIKILAFQSDKRSPLYPNIPTLKEKGIDYTALSFEGFIVPKGTSDEIVATLDAALAKTMEEPSLVDAFKKFDFNVEYRNHKEFTAYIAQQDKQLHEIVKEIGLIK